MQPLQQLAMRLRLKELRLRFLERLELPPSVKPKLPPSVKPKLPLNVKPKLLLNVKPKLLPLSRPLKPIQRLPRWKRQFHHLKSM